MPRRGALLIAAALALAAAGPARAAPKPLATLASRPLPPRDPSSGKIFNDFAAGGYFYLDNRDRAVVLTNDKHLYVIKEASGPGFAIDRDYDLSSVILPGDKGFSALP